MKTKKKFGMRRHIGITAAATLIALGATACEEAYWGKTDGESNKGIYEDFVKHFGSEDGSFDFEKVVVCGTREKDENGNETRRVMSANCLWNQNAEGNGENSKACSDDSIQHLKIMYATDAVIDAKNDAPPRVIVMCSLWQARKKLIAGIGPNGKMLESSDKDVDTENHYNLCVNADHNLCSDGDCSKLVCKELAYYVDGNGGYINCEQSEYSNWCKKISLGEIPDSFKVAFNYRTCPKDYTFASSYLESSDDYKLSNVCVKSVCGNKPVDLSSDNENCGACGNKCKNAETCVSGSCVGADKDKVLCDGEYIDPDKSTKHCGAKGECNDTRPTNENFKGVDCTQNDTEKLCADGRCVQSCPSHQVACNGECINPNTDNSYCGAKDGCTDFVECPDGKVCAAGVCQTSCLSDQALCGGKCINPNTDNAYCGAKGDCSGENSGVACPSGQVCSAGVCQTSCLSDQALCGGKCINPLTDNAYCGAKGDCSGENSGVACPSGQVCSAGVCQTSCLSDQALCGGKCINPLTDNMNCGAQGDCQGAKSGVACPSGQFCSNGTCQTSCLSDQALCGGKCINPLTDNANCGAKGDCSGENAGITCPSGQVCSAGVCQTSCLSDQALCGGKCINPLTDNVNCGAQGDCQGAKAGVACPSGQVCSGGKCGVTCVSDQILCNGQCIDPKSDNRYCGAQDGCIGATKCKDGEVCSGGKCGVTCVRGQVLCKGQCIDPKTDNRYCGATGDCSGSNIGKACESGTKCTDRVCKISCVSGQIACDGECIDPNTNPYFCGAKGNCAGDDPNQTNYKGKDCTKTSTTKLCSNKICTSSCPTDQENCNGFCINKGATNVVSCNNNSIQCKDGYGNCDGNVANGCEVNINNDNAHCRGCNQKCETTTISNSASVQCTKDGCIATSCKEGYVPSSDGKKCVESGELNCCGAKCTNCYTQYPNMDTGECNASTSTCTLRTCKDGYMLNSDKTKCVEIECKNDTECGDSGKCKDSECKCGNGSACSGNKPICNAGNCVECTSISHCSSKSNATAKCERNVCEYECNIGYHKDATGNCSPNSDTSCGDREGSSVTNCASPKPRCDKNKGECVECLGTKDCENNGKGFCKTDNTCYYTECDDEYTLSENNASCVLKVKRCGSPATDCTEIENQTSVACENNFCVVKSCTGNTHVYNPTDGGMQTGHGMCEENTTENCGSHGNKCGVEDGIGQVATCEASTTPAQCEYSCATDFTDCSSTSSGTKNSELICLKKGSGWGRSDFSSTCKNCVTQDSDHCTTGQTCNRSGGAKSGYTYSCSNTK